MSFSRKVISQMLAVIVSLCVVKFAKPQSGPTTDAVGGQDGVTIDTDQPAPYLLVSTSNSFLQLNPWPFVSPSESTGPVELLSQGNFDVAGLAYHYRFRRLYWGDSFFGRIYSASLNNPSVGKTEIASGVGYPADVSVDWINDKLYWTDRDQKKIVEYDLITTYQRTVLNTGSESLPTGLVVYPYPNYGWLYWTDRGRETIERVSVSGDGHEVIIAGLVRACIGPLTLDYFGQVVYWMDNCEFTLHSVNISGNQLMFNAQVPLPRSTSIDVALFEDILYWIESTSVYGLNRSSSANSHLIHSASIRDSFNSIAVVHPSKQPDGETFVDMILGSMNESTSCSTECVNGRCIPPGLCGCNKGWIGENCTTDRNECEALNGGCESMCVNIIGGYYCSCRGLIGYTLDDENGRNCTDVNECAISNGGCEHLCNNTLGSFQCFCFQGYTLSSNGFNCTRTPSSVILPRSTSVHTVSIMPTMNSEVLLAMSTRQPLSPSAGSHSTSIITDSELAPTSIASGQVPVATTSATPSHSTTPILVLASSISTSIPIPSPSTSLRTPSSSTPLSLLVTSRHSVDSTTAMMVSLSTASVSEIPQASLPATPPMRSLPSSHSQISESLSFSTRTRSSLESSTDILVKASSTVASPPFSTQSQSPPTPPTQSQSPQTPPTESQSPQTLLTQSQPPQTPPTQSQSPQTPSPPTGSVEISGVDTPLVVVISSSVAGGAALIVLVVLIIIVGFGCYLRQTHHGSYSFDKERQLATEPASLQGSKRRPDSVDSKTSFGLGSSQSSSPCSDV